MHVNASAASVCVSVAVNRLLPVLAIAGLLFSAATSTAQTPANTRNNAVALKKFVAAANKLSPEVRQHLSRGMQQYLRYANSVVNAAAPTTNFATAAPHSATPASRHALLSAPGPGGSIQVSDRSLDPSTQGYTQNTSSSAWCGKSVVVGYEDSGAFLRTDPTQGFGVPISQVGVSYSTNAGKTFTDLGFLTPGTFSANALIGDPVVTCTSPTPCTFTGSGTTKISARTAATKTNAAIKRERFISGTLPSC